jgi:hypothetical protein
MGACMLLDSAHCNLCTLKRRKTQRIQATGRHPAKCRQESSTTLQALPCEVQLSRNLTTWSCGHRQSAQPAKGTTQGPTKHLQYYFRHRCLTNAPRHDHTRLSARSKAMHAHDKDLVSTLSARD